MMILIPLSWLPFAVAEIRNIVVYLERLFPFFNAPGAYTWYAGDYLKYGQMYVWPLLAGLIFITPWPRKIYEKYKGSLISAVVLLMLFCAIAEFSRLWIIAQGVKEAAQQAVISTVNDNYDDVYHAVREGYAAGWYPDGTGRWDESIDTGDVYGQLSETLGLENTVGGYQKISDGEVEYTISDLSVVLENNSLGSGQSEGYTALVEIRLEVPVRFLGNLLPAASMTLHTEAKYVPLF